jgi:hypothetical protein
MAIFPFLQLVWFGFQERNFRMAPHIAYHRRFANNEGNNFSHLICVELVLEAVRHLDTNSFSMLFYMNEFEELLRRLS